MHQLLVLWVGYVVTWIEALGIVVVLCFLNLELSRGTRGGA